MNRGIFTGCKHILFSFLIVMVFMTSNSVIYEIHFYMHFHYVLLTELHNQPCYLNFDSVKLCLRKCLDFWFGFGFQIFFFFLAKV